MTSVKVVKCVRCGQPRKQSRKHVVLCPDCRYVLTEEERALWAPMTTQQAA